MRPARQPLLPVVLWGLVALLAVRFALFCRAAAVRPSHGFAAYYTAARLLRAGEPVHRFYDDDWFGDRIRRITPGVRDIYHANPPTTALLLLPLAGWDYPTARVLWTLFGLACLAISVVVLVRNLALRGLWIPAFIAGLLLYQPLYANVEQAQVYVLLLGLLTIAWQGYRRGRDGLLGGALAAMLVLKTAGLALWLLLISQRRWRALAWGVGAALLAVLTTLPWLGLEAWRTYLRLLAGFGGRPELAVTAYQTQTGLLRHLFSLHPQWNPSPLVHAPGLGSALLVLSLLGLLGVGIAGALERPRSDEDFAGFTCLSVILSPVSLDYHYCLLLLPIAVLIADARRRPSRRSWRLLGAATIAIGADLPYRSARLAAGAWALLAYPKLYGGWLLWALAACHRLRRRTPPGEGERAGGRP